MSYFPSKCDPDPLRHYLPATAPGRSDTEFSCEDSVERNNHGLVALFPSQWVRCRLALSAAGVTDAHRVTTIAEMHLAIKLSCCA
jgi:methionyl-tRNA synthetase